MLSVFSCQFPYLVLSISSKIVIFHWRHRGDSIRVGAAGLQVFVSDSMFGWFVCVLMMIFVFDWILMMKKHNIEIFFGDENKSTNKKSTSSNEF